jgi:hypothetical protein
MVRNERERCISGVDPLSNGEEAERSGWERWNRAESGSNDGGGKTGRWGCVCERAEGRDFTMALTRVRLVREKKIFECYIRCIGRMSGGVFNTDKKNYRTRQENARRI